MGNRMYVIAVSNGVEFLGYIDRPQRPSTTPYLKHAHFYMTRKGAEYQIKEQKRLNYKEEFCKLEVLEVRLIPERIDD